VISSSGSQQLYGSPWWSIRATPSARTLSATGARPGSSSMTSWPSASRTDRPTFFQIFTARAVGHVARQFRVDAVEPARRAEAFHRERGGPVEMRRVPCGVGQGNGVLPGQGRKVGVVDVDRQQRETVRARLFEEGRVRVVVVDVRVVF